MKINLLDLGTMEYGKCLDLQIRLRDMVYNGRLEDVLILVEHPPVLTLGIRGKRDNILARTCLLSEMGISVFETKRGGDVTYHGPGQIVGYPIINLKRAGLGARAYVEKIETMFINLLFDEYGIKAHKEDKEYTGVWIGKNKITANGIHISRMITMHGFAYNVNTNLDHFQLINPCGLPDRGVTSLAKLTGHKIDMDTAKKQLVKYFSQTFEAETQNLNLGEINDDRGDST
jgi:lipoyl(octanoyl) transferase